MILEEETYKKFGYYSTDLPPSSNKKIVAACDKCGKIRILIKNSYHDFCRSCSHKGSVHSLEVRRKISEGGRGRKFTEEHRRKIGEANKRRKLTEETRRKIGEGNKGKIITEETRRKISESNKGRKHSEETRRKISESNKGRKHSEETRRKISESNKGKIIPEETRRKVSEANGCREITAETRQKLSNVHKGRKHTEEHCKKLRGKNHPNWQGGKSFGKYCQKFNFALKEKIREKYNRKCYLCSKSEEENGERLSLHHIDNEKMQGCEDKSWFLIPLCRSCHMQLHADETKMQKKEKKNKVLYLQKSLL